MLEASITRVRLKSDFISVIIADNERSFFKHQRGYNGIASLALRGGIRDLKRRRNIFVPAYAGLNLEHYFDEHNRERDILFHPRRHPMLVARWKEANSAVLTQDPFAPWHVSYAATFVVSGNNRIDFSMEITPHGKEIEKSSFLGVFWASYIDHPAHCGINFMGHGRGEKAADKRWIYLETAVHGEKSSVMPAAASFIPAFAPELPKNWLFASKGDYVHDIPLFYGVSGGTMLAFMFKDKERVWFAHSPSGGGPGCPAWDFFALFPSPRAGETYKVRGRLIAKPFISAGDVLAEYDAFEHGT
ncbi:MAG: hypothetical protein Q6373_013180 [Candidatus Sigynarchaeota archaeon]